DVERLVAETLDADIVAQRIVDSVCGLLGARSAALYRLDAAAHRLVSLTVARENLLTFEWTRVLDADQGIAGLAVRERAAVWSADTLADARIVYAPDVIARLGQSSDRALLAVPLVVRDQVIGALAVGDATGRRFTDEDVRLAAAFADQAAIALANARLFAQETSRRAQTEALAEVEREMAAELDRDRLFPLIVQRASRLFAGHAVIHVLRGDQLVAAAGTGDSDTHSAPKLGRGLVGVAVQEREGFLVNDYAASPHADPRYVARGQSRAMGMPLRVRDQVLGIISVFRSGAEAPSFTTDDQAVLGSFAIQAAIALENARLHAESERRRRTAEHLADLGRLLSQSLDPEEVGQRIVESVRALFGVMRCALYGAPLGLDRLVVLGFSNDPSLGTGFGRDLVFQHGIGAVGLAVAERRLVMTPDLLDDPSIPLTPDVRAAFGASPIRAVVALPLVVGDTVTGVLATGDRAGRVFDDEEIRILGAFADQAAVALENARLYRRAREYGDRLLALERVNRLVSSSLDMDEVLQNVAAAVAQFFDAPYVAVWAFDPGTQVLRRALAHGDDELSGGLRTEIALGEGLVGW
ncbi:MAG TPA: GAF domain-containing protein, partial [Solirubrobacteraceae bacterium]